MSEVEKLYKNAGINKIGIKRCSGIKQGICLHNCNECESFDYKYPPFTAEKQIELVKWCCKKCRRFYIYNINDIDNFAENLAKEFNHYWQDLTEQERTEIKEILE